MPLVRNQEYDIMAISLEEFCTEEKKNQPGAGSKGGVPGILRSFTMSNLMQKVARSNAAK